MIKYIIEKKAYNKLKGKDFWRAMEKDKVCPGRTWQSLKERFTKKTIPKLDKYEDDADNEALANIERGFNGQKVNVTEDQDDGDEEADFEVVSPYFEDKENRQSTSTAHSDEGEDEVSTPVKKLIAMKESYSNHSSQNQIEVLDETSEAAEADHQPMNHDEFNMMDVMSSTPTQNDELNVTDYFQSTSTPKRKKVMTKVNNNDEGSSNGKSPYTSQEDEIIVNFIKENDGFAMRKGNQIWKNLERQNLLPGRSWQSLKNRFLKAILKNLSGEDFPAVAVSVMKPAKFYAEVEDEAILNYIVDNNLYTKVKGNNMWKILEDRKILVNRSAQSMKERFRKYIMPNLKKFDNVSEEERAKFQ